jgi:hypothetical protein
MDQPANIDIISLMLTSSDGNSLVEGSSTTSALQ